MLWRLVVTFLLFTIIILLLVKSTYLGQDKDYIVEQQESLDLVSGVLLPEEAESDFPFRFVGERTEFVRFVRALFITDRIVPVGGAKMLHCVRHLMRLLHVPEGNNLSNVINKLVCTDNQLRFFDKFRRDLEKQILSGR